MKTKITNQLKKYIINRHEYSKKLLFVLLPLLLCQCAKSPETQFRVNQQLTSPYTEPAETYMEMAEQQEGREKQQALLYAAGRLIYDGHWQKGLSILSQTSRLTSQQWNEKRLLLAKINLMREQPSQSLKQLALIQHIDKEPLFYQVQYHEMLAKSYQSQKKATEAVNERVKLDQLLPDENSRENNRRDLWLSLNQLSVAELNTLAIETSDNSELQGWMRLALIPRQSGGNAEHMIHAVEDWRQGFPGHSANKILPASLSQVSQKMYEKPRKIAVLLPLTGPFSGPGQAIKDGLISARKESQDYIQISFYDTSAGAIKAIYHQAVDEGAGYVVGPLLKSEVAEIAGISHPVPTILLNDVTGPISDQAYVFGLSPSSEAQQVAAKARKNGHSRALIIAPQDNWGEEISTAFIQQWQINDGLVIDQLRYKKDDNFDLAMKDFLHITQSLKREKQLKTIFGKKLETTPRRRQDFDMIFLLAYPKEARQLMPLIKYYYAGDVPVYSTSSVYAGYNNTIKDRDLDGIIFCDMPWVFVHQQPPRQNWPEQLNSYNRLYALGMDSYSLINQLNQLLLFPAMGTSDNSGVLYLNASQKIARILEWATFDKGLARAQEYKV